MDPSEAAPPIDAILADRRTIDALAAGGLITGAARDFALDLVSPPRRWARWSERLLLAFGLSLVLAGAISFFAFDWAKIPPFVKLGSIEIALVGAVAAGWRLGLDRVTGKAALTAAAVLVGVFLAVFGQIYQTGADAEDLFLGWALLILPWVAISECAALWLVWLAVCDVFLALRLGRVPPSAVLFSTLLPVWVALFDGLFLVAREVFAARGVDWLRGRWTRAVLLVAVLVGTLLPTLRLLVESSLHSEALRVAASATVVVHVGCWLAYRFVLRDLRSVAAIVLSGCVLVEGAVLRSIVEAAGDAEAAMFLVMGFATLAVFTLALVWLRATARHLAAEGSRP